MIPINEQYLQKTQHWTPDTMADDLAELGIRPLLRAGLRPDQIRVIDPCVGQGSLLIAAMRLLVRERMQQTKESWLEAADNLSDCVFGVDLDPTVLAAGQVKFRQEFGFEFDSQTGSIFDLDISDRWLNVALINPPYFPGSKLSSIYPAKNLAKIKAYWGTVEDLNTGRKKPEGTADLAAYVLRRTAEILSDNCNSSPKTIAMVATNTISQGGTGRVGISHLVASEGWGVYSASDDIKWPGKASVTVRTVGMCHGINLTLIGGGRMYRMVRLHR